MNCGVGDEYCLITEVKHQMGSISTWMSGSLSALLMSLMALWFALVDQNPFQDCLKISCTSFSSN